MSAQAMTDTPRTEANMGEGQESIMNVKEYSRRKYRPLDVHSWGEAYKVTIGWLFVVLFAFITGILLAMYELQVINKGDRDLRDMIYDFRLTSAATNYYHKYFINGDQCCNWDPVFFEKSSCVIPEMNTPSSATKESNQFGYNGIPPFCPPTVVLRCPNLTSFNCNKVNTERGGHCNKVNTERGGHCNKTRESLYLAVGLTSTGQYLSCSQGGKTMVGAIISNRAPEYSLVAFDGTNAEVDEMAISPTQINQSEVQGFVNNLIRDYGDPEFVLPQTRLSKAATMDGAQLNLKMGGLKINGSNGFKAIKNWPTAIFDFPGLNKRCPNTLNKEEWIMTGTFSFDIPVFDYDRPNTMTATFNFLNDSSHIPLWKVQLQPTSSSQVNDTELNFVNVSLLTDIQVFVGMTAVAGACNGWFIDPNMSQTYNQSIFVGTIADLRKRTATIIADKKANRFNNDSLGGGPTSMNIHVRDVSAPIKIASPPYYGMWYIVFCFGMAAVWTWSLGPYIVFILPLIWWNVRSNKGMPPIVYRYMEKYRGW